MKGFIVWLEGGKDGFLFVVRDNIYSWKGWASALYAYP
jgi:hypothetical protein